MRFQFVVLKFYIYIHVCPCPDFKNVVTQSGSGNGESSLVLGYKLRLAWKQWIPTPYILTSWYKSQLHLLLICWFLHEIVRNFALKIELPTASKTALLIFAWNSRKPYLSWEILIKNLKSIWYPKSDKNLMFDFEIMPYFRSGRCGGKEEHRKSALNMVFRESKSLSSTRTVDIPQRTTNSPKSFPG